MESAKRHMDGILRRASKGAVLMLDFDGTLSPIVPLYTSAKISPGAQRALRGLLRRMPVAVISGRSISDLRKRVGLPRITLIGCHGLEVSIEGRRRRVAVAISEIRIFNKAKRELISITKAYRGAAIEDKTYGLAVHYRKLPPAKRVQFRRAARSALQPYLKRGLRVIDHLSAFDLSFATVTKGSAALLVYRALAKNCRSRVPVYIGDGKTDEDVFRVFKNGITIRVGKNLSSAARYYFASRREVDAFLLRLSKNIGVRKVT